MEVRHPQALRTGDEVAVVSPAGPLRDRTRLAEGLRRLRRWGLRPRLMPAALDSAPYVAGTDERRAADLQAAIDDPTMRAIFCVRGGYGTMRLLPRLDFGSLARDPRPVVGQSDVTALLSAIWRQAGVVSLHGPMLATPAGQDPGIGGSELQRRLLMEPDSVTELPTADAEPPQGLRTGHASGRLVGGNLTMVCALIGTPWQVDTRGAIVFLEDTGEPPYRLDRLFTQLLLSGAFDEAAGVALGDFGQSAHRSLIEDRLGHLRVPVACGLPFGHRPAAWTLPFGGLAQLTVPDAGSVPTLTLVEAGLARP